jgi:predicted RNA-binding Zn-ribbon protein involved in translation (DUF1610 family)
MNFNNNDDLTQANLNNNSNDEYSFALCNLCFWCATIFFKLEKRENRIPYVCPLCFNSDIVLISLSREMPMKYEIIAKII